MPGRSVRVLVAGLILLLGPDFLSHFRINVDNARGLVELAPK